jgi:hypothetical protein
VTFALSHDILHVILSSLGVDKSSCEKSVSDFCSIKKSAAVNFVCLLQFGVLDDPVHLVIRRFVTICAH